MKTYEMYIDGKFTAAKSGATRDIIDPANGELIAKVPESTKEDAVLAIKAARKAFDEGGWRKSLALDRGKLLFKVADLIRANAKKVSRTGNTKLWKAFGRSRV